MFKRNRKCMFSKLKIVKVSALVGKYFNDVYIVKSIVFPFNVKYNTRLTYMY